MYLSRKTIKIVSQFLSELRSLSREKISEDKLEIGTNLMQLGNIFFASLVLGQAFGGFEFNYSYALGGFTLWLFLYVGAILLMRKQI